MAVVDLDASCKYAPTHLGRVLVLGLGKSGRAAADYLVPLLGERVEALAVAAGSSAAATAEVHEYVRGLKERGVEVAFDHEHIEGTYDLGIASPGISQFSAFYESAAEACAEVISEVEFAWRESAHDARWVAVTGTNGKTTTVALIEHLLRTAGMDARAVGNIGDTCLEAVAVGGTSVYVAETSSYQLASTARFAPNVAVLLNITPDHLSWHRSFEAYTAAKLKVLANLSAVPGAVAVLDATCDVTRQTVRTLRQQAPAERGFDYVPVGTAAGLGESMRERCGAENAAYVREGRLHVEQSGCDHDLGPVADLQIKGPHNIGNALAAAVAAVALGASDAHIRAGLASFAPLEHRIEPCGSVNGVACYNDSKATNVDAVLVALDAFEPGSVVALFGGRDKGTDLAPLVERARATCKAVVLFGESRDRFQAAFCAQGSGPAEEGPGSVQSLRQSCSHEQPTGLFGSCGTRLVDTTGTFSEVSEASSTDAAGTCSGAPSETPAASFADAALQVLLADHLEDALDVALDVAEAGNVVLLSPACASFDEFSCFEERGHVFKELVAARSKRVGN